MPDDTAPKQTTVPRLETNRLTGLKKRQQIQAAGRAVFVWVAIGAAALSFCAVTVQFLFTKWQHNTDVLNAKYQAANILDKNIANARELTKNVDALAANQNLAAVKTAPNDPNTKSVLDALSATLDPAALATSLQQIVLSKSGVTIENIAVPQELQSSVAAKAIEATPQPIVFSFVVSGSYDKIHQMIIDIERTIRPIQINSINITGTDASLRASVNATTYYQPAKTVTVQEKTIQ